MTKDEALKLALEALEAAYARIFTKCEQNLVTYNGVDVDTLTLSQEAITAIKEALAQPEQERFLVATIGNWGRVEWVDGVFPSLGDKMYSAPRTWVGLTEDEVALIVADCSLVTPSDFYFAQTIEAKLKEKNT